jgi:hypothetical protein
MGTQLGTDVPPAPVVPAIPVVPALLPPCPAVPPDPPFCPGMSGSTEQAAAPANTSARPSHNFEFPPIRVGDCMRSRIEH